MEVQETNIPDVLVFLPSIYEDDRGFFVEVYRKDIHLVQSRISFSSNFIMVDVNYLFYLSDSLLSLSVPVFFNFFLIILTTLSSFHKYFFMMYNKQKQGSDLKKELC